MYTCQHIMQMLLSLFLVQPKSHKWVDRYFVKPALCSFCKYWICSTRFSIAVTSYILKCDWSYSRLMHVFKHWKRTFASSERFLKVDCRHIYGGKHELYCTQAVLVQASLVSSSYQEKFIHVYTALIVIQVKITFGV